MQRMRPVWDVFCLTQSVASLDSRRCLSRTRPEPGMARPPRLRFIFADGQRLGYPLPYPLPAGFGIWATAAAKGWMALIGGRGCEGRVKARRRRGMVNAGLVNAGSSYFSPPSFCESFPVFGRIPRFQNPFKYICRSRISHETKHTPSGRPGERLDSRRYINALAHVKTSGRNICL